jgi:DnaK suppressor protein
VSGKPVRSGAAKAGAKGRAAAASSRAKNGVSSDMRALSRSDQKSDRRAKAAGKVPASGRAKTKLRSKSQSMPRRAEDEARAAGAVSATSKAHRTDPKAKGKKKVSTKALAKTRAETSGIVLPEGYRPSDSEPFMNERHRAYFRRKLLSWKEEIIRQTRETIEGLHEESAQHADLADRATAETDRALELRARDRQRKLISKIDAALGRIEDGTYGYCEETGEPISLKRLDARPIATLSIEAQERHERRERVYRED